MLRWSREAPAIEWLWRSWCAHWVHLDLNHALLNAAGFLLVAAWLSTSLSVRGWIIVTASAIVSIDIGLWSLTSFVCRRFGTDSCFGSRRHHHENIRR